MPMFHFFIFVDSANDLETIKQSYVNTINQLNQELLAMKQINEQSNRKLFY
jgi:hypothetical protein